MEIKLPNGTTANILGWENRFSTCSRIAELLDRGDETEGFRLVYRGDQNCPPLLTDLFTAGMCSRAQNNEGKTEKLKFNVSLVSGRKKLFFVLLKKYLKTAMALKYPGESLEQSLQRFDKSQKEDRYEMTQLLLDAMQYQNCKQEVREFREYLLSISASTSSSIAAKYAIKQQPSTAYIFEYYPPDNPRFLSTIKQNRQRFSEFGFGQMYPDRDDEILLRYSILPHYLIGYAQLNRTSTTPLTYSCTYNPNPHYANGTATLKNPPDLNAQQQKLFDETNPSTAWVVFKGDGRIELVEGETVADVSLPQSEQSVSTVDASDHGENGKEA